MTLLPATKRRGTGAGVPVGKNSAGFGLLVKPERAPTADGTPSRVSDATCTSLHVLATDAGE